MDIAPEQVDVQELMDRIAAVFADVPRPDNDRLLHPACFDDGDLQALYRYRHWSAVPGEVIEREYAALFFLSPSGFRHFLPAYLCFCLTHAQSGAAALEATLMSLSNDTDSHFTPSRFGELADAERQVVVAFLEEMGAWVEVDGVLIEWWDRLEG